jgi:hypothetical protein
MAVGAVVASVSAATFIYTTNQAARREEYALHERARNEARQDHQLARQEAREDRNDSMRATGTLLPHTPAAVRLRLPEDGEGPTLRASMSLDGKLSCDPSLITATLVAIESPPPPLDPGRVMRAYSPSVDGCRSAELWLHPSWVALEKPSTGDISD